MSSSTKTILWSVLVSAVILAGLVYVSDRSAPKVASGSTALAAEETNFSFGTVSMAKGKVTHDYVVANPGSEPITINKVFTSCMCTVASILTASSTDGPFGMAGHGFLAPISRTLAPGEKATVRVVFDPAAHGPSGIGPISRTVTIETNSGSRPLNLSFGAVVAP